MCPIHRTRNSRHLRSALGLALLWLAASAGGAPTTQPGPFHELAGEYRGTVKRTQLTVWATPVAVPGGGQATVMMLFPDADRQSLLARLEVLAGDQAALYRRACDGARVTEYGYDYNSAFSRIWQSGAALVFIYSDPGRRGFAGSGWRSPTARSGMLMNEEYMSLRGREYMVREVKRGPRTGRLIEVRLTQTGFLQNFFDNPKLQLTTTDAPAGVLELLRGYVNAKYAAMENLQIGGVRLPTTPLPICR